MLHKTEWMTQCFPPNIQCIVNVFPVTFHLFLSFLSQIDSFELLYYYDEQLGHLMWYDLMIIISVVHKQSWEINNSVEEHRTNVCLPLSAWIGMINLIIMNVACKKPIGQTILTQRILQLRIDTVPRHL